MVAWGPIIGAGISALGSLFGGGKKEEKQTVDYVAMARAAEKAGFNPLTVLRNGGSAGFTTTHHPGLSAQDKFGEAFGILGNALMSFDARADERAELEMGLMRQQLARGQRSLDSIYSPMKFGDVPAAAGSRHRGMDWFDGSSPERAMPTHIYATNEGGKLFRIANPALPDNEQLIVPGLAETLDKTGFDKPQKPASWGPILGPLGGTLKPPALPGFTHESFGAF